MCDVLCVFKQQLLRGYSSRVRDRKVHDLSSARQDNLVHRRLTAVISVCSAGVQDHLEVYVVN